LGQFVMSTDKFHGTVSQRFRALRGRLPTRSAKIVWCCVTTEFTAPVFADDKALANYSV